MSTRLLTRWPVVALTTAVVGLVGIPALSQVASASSSLPALPAGYTVSPVPSSGAFPITGRAWGHRIGLSQVGAQYAGRAGFSAAAILAHYYPGTKNTLVTSTTWRSTWPGTPAAASRPLLRVYVEANRGSSLTVTAAPGLRVVIPSGQQYALPAIAGAVRWRLVGVSTAHPTYGLTLQYATSGSAWRTVSSPWPLSTAFLSSTGVRVELAGGATRTEPAAVALTTTKVGSVSWITVSRVDPESYLAAVVASEIGPSSAPATLQAQAIAARSYAARLASLYGATRNYDVCAATCQYYPGVATGTVVNGPAKDKLRAYASTSAAVGATRDRILTYKGAPALTMFAAANGGYTRSGGQPYLPAQPDPWDTLSKSSSHAWSASLPASVLARFIPAGDRLTALSLGGRDGNGDLGGPATLVVLDSVSATGVAHRSTTTPSALRSAWGWPSASTGLRSTWFAVVGAVTPTPTPTPSPTPPPASSPAPTPPPASSTPSLRPAVLHRGMSGKAVTALQRVLGMSATGYFGPTTKAYVARWQTRHHLVASGYVDHALYVRLRLPLALLPR